MKEAILKTVKLFTEERKLVALRHSLKFYVKAGDPTNPFKGILWLATYRTFKGFESKRVLFLI